MKQEVSSIEESLIYVLKTLNNMCDRLKINYKDEFDIDEIERSHCDVDESEE